MSRSLPLSWFISSWSSELVDISRLCGQLHPTKELEEFLSLKDPSNLLGCLDLELHWPVCCFIYELVVVEQLRKWGRGWCPFGLCGDEGNNGEMVFLLTFVISDRVIVPLAALHYIYKNIWKAYIYINYAAPLFDLTDLMNKWCSQGLISCAKVINTMDMTFFLLSLP